MSEEAKLLDYLIVVGPSTKLPDEETNYSPTSAELNPSPLGDGEWDSIYKPKPEILRRFPEIDNPECPLAHNVVYFCQPEGCVKERNREASHIFMLTNTETNVRTYGVCISFPHLIDPLARAQSCNWQYENEKSVSIQELGLLSVCILSRYQCFRFFKKCLRALIHFVESYCGSSLSWDLLIHSKFSSSSDPNYGPVRELEQWLHNLLELPVPKDGIEVLEVELEVDPALLVGFPPLSRLPLFDLGVHELFEMLDVHLVMEIFQLLLLEQKVILHSEDQGVVSQCILTVVILLYPLQYLFPVIPLLPTCLSNVENLLLVPTPYFIGVCTSFIENVCSFHCAEAWIINLDKKTIIEPKMHKIARPEFPLSLFHLQADIRRSLDKLNPVGSPESSEQSFQTYPYPDSVSLEDEIDVQIRLAFAEFILGGDMLGLVEDHLFIYRLFPRPVVTLKLSSFMASYSGDKEFMKIFVKSQSVEYYLEWSLNPSNKAFEEITKGVCNIENISDKITSWIQRTRPSHMQYTLYSSDPNSLLYQEMLNNKATQSTVSLKQIASDDSDFEMVGYEYCNGGSDSTPPYSECGSSPFSPKGNPNTLPVSIEFHPPTPTTAITTTAVSNSNETFLSLQDDETTCDIELKEVLVSSPEPHPVTNETGSISVNSSPECISLSDTVYHTPIVDSTPESSNPNIELASNIEISNNNKNPTDHSSVQFHTPDDCLEGGDSSLTVTDTSLLRGGGLIPDMAHLSPVLDSQNVSLTMATLNISRSATPEQKSIPRSSSWLNLTGGSIEMLQFVSTKPEDSTDGTVDGGTQEDNIIRSVPWSSVSSLHELELQIKEIVGRIGDGNGLPWYKTQALKSISSEERSRIALLRVLEVRLGVRKQTDAKLSADGEIKPVVLAKPVYKGVLELLKYLMQFIEAELVKDTESPVFSLFLILRLALCLCTKAPRKRSQSTKSPTEREANYLLKSYSLRKNKLGRASSPASTAPSIDKGSSSLGPLSSQEQSSISEQVGQDSIDGQNLSGLNGTDKIPQEIELQQIAGDSPPKHPRPLLKVPSKKVMISSPASDEGEDAPLMYLHNDLIRGLGPSFKELVVKRPFWTNVFVSVVHTDRKYLGWNEKTAELYDRYNTLSPSKRMEFAYEEDILLSVILHNVLLFLLMMGVSPRDTIDLCRRLSAKTRLASIEEKLLQQTLAELEDAEEGDHIDIKDIAVLSLYSETCAVVIFVVHHGISVTAPIFKLQITDDACILRRFPDEKITCRFWNDCISNISHNDNSMTVSFYYQENMGEYTHHFHSKQFSDIFHCMQTIIAS